MTPTRFNIENNNNNNKVMRVTDFCSNKIRKKKKFLKADGEHKRTNLLLRNKEDGNSLRRRFWFL